MTTLRTSAFFLFLAGILLFNSASAQFAGGSGTADDPFQVSTPEQLAYLSNYTGEVHYGTYFMLINDIDLDLPPYNQDEGWLPIGTADDDRFGGNFNGDGFTISGLFIDRPAEDNQALFGFVFDATIENVCLDNVDVTGNWYVGALSAINYYSTTYNCCSKGSVSGNWFVGGLTGGISTGPPPAGYGYSKIYNSWSSCIVNGTGKASGGLAGSMTRDSELIDCFATGNVNGNERVGGLCGQVQSAYVTNCYSAGSVTGNIDVGGMVGLEPPPNPQGQPAVFEACYWDVETSGQTTSQGGEGRNTDEMTWPYAGNTFNGWNFEEIWDEDTDYNNNGYPYLQTFNPEPEGSTCENSYWINLPLENFEGDTGPMGNHYSKDMISPPSYYINGNDMVFKFSVSQTALLFGDMTASDSYIGVFIMHDCPDPDNPALLDGWSTSYINTLAIPSENPSQPQEILLLPGDYFLIVSSYPPPETIQFTLNLWLEPLSGCPPPILPFATDITATSAALGWTETGTADQWDILYGETGFDPAVEGTLIEGVTLNPYELTGLGSGTDYDFYVRSVCDEDQVSDWAGPRNFRTECDFAYSSAFTEGFESENAPAECWQMWYENPDPPEENLMTHATDESFSGDRSFKFSSWVSGPPYFQFLRTPELDFEDSLEVSFKYFGLISTPQVVFSTGYSFDGEQWFWGDDITDGTNLWKDYSGIFPPGAKYIAVQYKGTYMQYLYIDDFTAAPLLYPEISTDPEEFSFALVSGNTATGELSVYNSGGAELQYSVMVQEGFDYSGHNNQTQIIWLSVSPEQGTVEPGAIDILNLTVDTDGLAPGYYQAQIVITSNDPVNPEIIVPAYLDVVTGMNEQSLQKVAVYPVPASDYVFVTTAQNMISVSIINASGELIRHIDGGNKHDLKITASAFLPGVYFLKIICDEGIIITKKLVIQ
jgi:hypothetical protein